MQHLHIRAKHTLNCAYQMREEFGKKKKEVKEEDIC